MNIYCKKIVIYSKAIEFIKSETYKKLQTETGGILLGQIFEDIWYIIEVIEPGPASIFHKAYFEYDTNYVNQKAREIATKYKIDLTLLGLWHRHPGSFDSFSTTDDGTNLSFAKLNSKGAISGLVNLVPDFRLKIYHVTDVSNQPHYDIIKYEIDDKLIPFEFLQLKQNLSDNKISDNFNIPNVKIDDNEISKNTETSFIHNQNYSLSIEQNEDIKIKKTNLEKIFAFFRRNINTINQSGNISNATNPTSQFKYLNEHVKTEKEDQEFLDILMTEEEFLLKQNLYDYETEIINDKIKYTCRLKSKNGNYPKIVTFQLVLKANELTFITESNENFPYRERIFLDYLTWNLKYKTFKG